MNGKKLAFLRKQRGITQEQLADELGASKISVSFWERGARVPEVDMLVRIADYFDVAVDYLLDRTDIPNIYKQTTVQAELKSPVTIATGRVSTADSSELEALVKHLVRKALEEQEKS